MSNKFSEYVSNVKSKYKLKNHITYYILIAFTLIFTVVSLTGGMKRSSAFLLEQMGYSIILAVSLSLVVGFLGELSLGHAGFMCLGAYFAAYFQNTLAPDFSKSLPLLSLIVAMLIGGLVAAVFGFIIGLPALRLKGDYLAIVTLAFGEIVKVVFENANAFGGAFGIKNAFRFDTDFLFIVIFVTALLTVAVVNNLIRSKHGRAITAIRDNEIAARAMGVNVSFYKITVFVLSAFLAGVGGALFAASSNSFSSKTFDYNYSINILVMVVLGGMGSINGSIISAAVITFLNVKLAATLTGNLAALKNLIYAFILIGIVIYNNAPALKEFRAKYNLRNLWSKLYAWLHKLFCKKKPVDDPAAEKADEGDWSKIPTKVEMDAILSTDLTPDANYVPDKPDKPDKEKGGEQ